MIRADEAGREPPATGKETMRRIERREQRLRPARLLAALLAVAASGCSPPPAARNVVLVMVDTLRADHLSSYGYHRPTSPHLDALATSGGLFLNARSQAACTFPSANSLFTSRYPMEFVRPDGKDLGIPKSHRSMAEILKAQGLATLAVSASPIVRRTPSKYNPSAGFGRGFDVFDEKYQWGSADRVTDRALGLLEKISSRQIPEPFFLYLHYMDPHDPYDPPAESRRFSTEPPEGAPEFILRGDANPMTRMIYGKGPEVAYSERDLQHLIDLYDDEVSYFDAEFRRLMDEIERLEESGEIGGTLIVIASDHGEEFLEHRELKHCRALYEASTRTPLIFRLPRTPAAGSAGRQLATPVENLDILPTVLDYLGLEEPEAAFQGESLRPLIESGDPTGEHYAFSWQGRLRSINDQHMKLIVDVSNKEFRMFDLVADPAEQLDLFDTESRDTRRLARHLSQWLQEVENGLESTRGVETAAAIESRLKALGYLE